MVLLLLPWKQDRWHGQVRTSISQKGWKLAIPKEDPKMNLILGFWHSKQSGAEIPIIFQMLSSFSSAIKFAGLTVIICLLIL